MSYVVFARKWRPQVFDEVIGQEHITTTLKNAILNNRVAHAYIFTGPRGIGKTSAARILAKGLNCETGPTVTPCNKCTSCKGISSGTSMDVIEIDGASNNSVDQVRELRENIKFSPAYGRFKVYIIDEVHMLSIGAFNALLKTLEEPPGHAKFIFATTNPEKVPATILSRCQRFDFRRIPLKLIMSKLKKITETEKLKISDGAIFSVARASDGSMRDAESILDQLTSFCDKKIDEKDVIALLGTIEEDRLADIVEKIARKDTAAILKAIDELIFAGKDISLFLTGLMGYIRHLMVLKVSSGLTSLIDLPESHVEVMKGHLNSFTLEELLYIFYTLSATAAMIKRSEVSRFIVEAAFIKLSLRSDIVSLPEIIEKIEKLEAGSEGGISRETTLRKDDIGLRRHNGYNPKYNEAPRVVHSVSGESPPVKVEGQLHMKDGGEASGTIAVSNKEHPEQTTGDDNDAVKITREFVQRVWPQVIDTIKGKRISIASYLMEGRLVKVEGNIITLGFAKKYNLHREVLEKGSNKAFVEEVLCRILNQKMRLAYVVIADSEAQAEEEGLSASEVAGKELETEFENGGVDDSIIQSALDIFNGKVIRKQKGYE